MTKLRLERLTRNEEFEACVHLQQATWKYSAGELFPRRAFLLAERVGGHVLGAYDDAAAPVLVAFNLAYPGYRDGSSYLHSQMLAVLPAYRNTGIGRALKLQQRDIALAQGIDLIEWTYDPLEVKNAFFNLERLGAVSRRYVRDFYGPSSSPLQGGLPTDRLYAEWWVRSKRVEKVLAGEPLDSAAERTIEVPFQIDQWKQDGDPRAAETQARLGADLEAAFAGGLVVTGYARQQDGGGRYCLSRKEIPPLGLNQVASIRPASGEGDPGMTSTQR